MMDQQSAAAPRVKIVGRNARDLLPTLAELGLDIDEQSPQVVVCYGGDGTLLRAEREWPGLPKVALRDSRRCRTCTHHSNQVILQHLAEGTLRQAEFIKLQGNLGDSSVTGLNDIIIRNARLTSGVRFRIWIDDEAYGDEEIVGDGLVVATPFGSTAYYRSITSSTFRVGMGLAFNNSIEPIDHQVLDDSSRIRVRITRGPALMAADNQPETVALEEGDEIQIARADSCARILAYDKVRYPTDQFIY